MGRHPIDTSIYFNIESVWHKLRTLNFLIGGRGIGKTYSTIDYVLSKIVPAEKKFIYMRNTDVQLSESASFMGNPFKKWNTDHDRNICLVSDKKHYNIIDSDDNNKLIGYGTSLSTSGNLRGMDLSDVSVVLFDEFIEKRPLLFDQYDNFCNIVETINRNREIEGDEPCIFICLSNAQKIDNPILIGYGLVPHIEKMIRSEQKIFRNEAVMVMLPEAKVSQLKENTSLYIASRGSAYADHALWNKFSNDDFHDIPTKSPNLNEYKCLYKVDEFYVWKHKFFNSYYICSTRAVNVKEYNTADSLSLFMRSIGLKLREAYYLDEIRFSDYVVKSKFINVFRGK